MLGDWILKLDCRNFFFLLSAGKRVWFGIIFLWDPKKNKILTPYIE